MSRILTVEQAAEKLQLSPKAVRKYLRTGKLPGRKIGKAWRLVESDLERFISRAADDSEQIDPMSLFGIFADVPGFSTEDFARRRAQDIEIENRRFTEAQQ